MNLHPPLTQIKLLILAFLLSCAVHLVASQRLYAAGSFKSITPISRNLLPCYDHSQKTWRRNTVFQNPSQGSAIISETESYYVKTGTYAQLTYQNNATSIPVNGVQGIFYTQTSPNSTISGATLGSILVNADRTMLWVVGTFTHVGSSAATIVTMQGTIPQIAIAAFDISSNKVNPTLVSIPSASAYNFTGHTELFTQGKSLVIGMKEYPTSSRRLFRLTTTSWTSITDVTQDLNAANFYQLPDESIYAYGPSDVLSKAVSVSGTPTIGRLPVDGISFFATLTNYQFTSNYVYGVTFSSTLWVPTPNKEIYFVHKSVNLTGSTNEHLMAKDTLMQYLYKATEGAGVTIVGTNTRLVSSPSLSSFPNIEDILGRMVFDNATNKIMIEGTFDHIVYGSQQNVYQTPVTNEMVQNKNHYRAVMTTVNRVYFNPTTNQFENFLGGSGPYTSYGSSPVSISSYVPLPGTTFTCFYNAISGNYIGFNHFSPLIMSYSNDSWTPVPLLSGMIDSIVIKNSLPQIYAIERASAGVTSDVYIGGYFKSINNQTFNSIVKYTVVNGAPLLQNLDGGVLNYDVVPEGYNTFNDYSRYYNITPGAVYNLAYDPKSQKLFVQGSFRQAGSSLNVYNLAYWSEVNKNWNDMGSYEGSISKMLIHDNYLVVSGSLSRVGSLSVRNIARYNIANNTWEAMGQGASSPLTDMIVYMGSLLVAGTISGRRIGINSDTLSVWNPSTRTWFPLPTSASSDSLCYTTSPSCTLGTTSRFQIANGKLFVVTSDLKIMAFNGNQFETITTTPTFPITNPVTTFIKTGLEPNTRIIMGKYASPIGTVAFSQEASNFASSFYNFDRNEDPLTDNQVIIFVGSGSSVKLSLVTMFASLLFALLLILF